MGVNGTYCRICGLPVQHDHYIPADGGMYVIYRGDGELHGAEMRVRFGPEHDWLKRGVALATYEGQEPRVIEGEIQDGVIEPASGGGEDDDLEDRFVGYGVDARAAVHAVCWELAGRAPWSGIEGARWTPELDRYHEQLFEFEQMIADGHGWMLVDPRLDTPEGNRSRERIEKIIRERATRS